MNTDHSRVVDHIEDRLYRYRARRLRFLINGDKFFSGINYALNTEKTRSFDALLNELTGSLMDHIKLCKGVRFIFALDGTLATTLDDLKDGNTYICSSIDTFILTDYRINNGMLNWLIRNSACISSSGNVVRSKRQVNTSNINNNFSNISSTVNTPTANSKLLLSPATKTTPTVTSHNNSRYKSNGTNNHTSNKTIDQINGDDNNLISQPESNRTVKTTPVSNNGNLPSPASATRRPPKKVVDNNLSHNRKSNTSRTRNSTANRTSDTKAYKKIEKTNQVIADVKIQKDSLEFGQEVIDKYDIGRPIGDGHFSVVYCCMNKVTQEFCALKLIDKLKCRGRDDMIYNEVKILKQLQHPNIVKLIEEFDYSEQLYLILELVHDGDLFDAISTVTKFDEVHVATMIHNLSSALTYLHKQGIVHRDIKPENLLISVQDDGSQSVKLADFGLAVEVGDNPLYSVCGTAFYVSPEMLNETGYDHKVDVWSTGVICFILLCGYPPFTSENESNQDELFDAILTGHFQFAPPYWSKISQHAKNLIKCMLTVDPEKRYTAEQVFRNSWTMGTSDNFEGVEPMNMSRKIALQSQ